MHQSSRTYRCFIALYPNQEARDAVEPVIEELREWNDYIRWERTSQLHITLKFLGDVTAEQVRSIEAMLRARVEGTAPIETLIDLPGAFPNFRQPKVVWLGFSKRSPAMDAVRQAVEDVCVTVGFPRELKSFTPHFTIGRVKGERRIQNLEKAVNAGSFAPVPVRFDDIRIMESTLSPGGAVHREVFRIEFQRP